MLKYKYDVTIKEAEQFAKYVFEYQEKLQLANWDIFVTCKKLRSRNIEGETSADARDRCATIRINKYMYSKPNYQLLALHEILHVFLANTYYIGQCRYATQDELYTAHEDDVTKLANILIKEKF